MVQPVYEVTPSIIIYILLQEKIMSGIAAGAIKE